MSNIAKVQHLK